MSKKEQYPDQLIVEIENSDYDDHENNMIDCVFIPDAEYDDSSASDDEEMNLSSIDDEEQTSDDEDNVAGGAYEVFYEKYNEKQKAKTFGRKP